MNYVMVLLVPFYRVDENTIACESAFAIHLKALLPRISSWGKRIVIHSPLMTEQAYQQNKSHLAHIDCEKDSIHYVSGPSADLSRSHFLLRSPFIIWPAIWKVVRSANVIHASASKDILKLFTIISIIFAVIQRKKTIFVMDIDHRNSAKMSYETGKLSRKSYWLCRYVYNPLISLQIRFAARFCHLVMLKGQPLVDDYGKGRDKVKNFYDTAHDLSFVLSEERLTQKIAALDEANADINVVYFGRLMAYKGIMDMIIATHKANKKLSVLREKGSVSLTIIGAGEQEAELKLFVAEQQLHDVVHFKGAMSYGEELFDCLAGYDFLLAAPHSEDTPRSVFDAMACGLPMIAYDTYYYNDLVNTGTVKTVPWLSTDAMADKIVALSSEPETVKEMMLACRKFAVNNTQKIWLDKRLAWTETFLS
jgi:glycosyltransferase involved in cell wall biosynthesis